MATVNLVLKKKPDGEKWTSTVEHLLKSEIVPGYYNASGHLSYQEAQAHILKQIRDDADAILRGE